MAYNNTEQKVYDIALPIAEKNGLSVWDVEFKKEGSDYYLRVYVDGYFTNEIYISFVFVVTWQ